MKKIKLFMLTAVVMLGFGISSCGGDGAGGVGTKSCSNAAQAWADALTNWYTNTDNEAYCEAWKDAWADLVSKCGGRDYFGSQAEYEAALAEVEAIDCSSL